MKRVNQRKQLALPRETIRVLNTMEIGGAAEPITTNGGGICWGSQVGGPRTGCANCTEAYTATCTCTTGHD